MVRALLCLLVLDAPSKAPLPPLPCAIATHSEQPSCTDKTRPACQRCLKSGYTCKGYDLGLRMQSLVVITEPKGSQRLAKISPPSKPSQHEQRVGRELSLVAFQEQIAFSYFFATYGWASFWKPFLELAQESDLSTTSHTCSLALAYGHMGLGHSEKSLQSMGLELYGRSLREVQSLLTHGVGTKTDLARLTVPVVILGMYSVRSALHTTLLVTPGNCLLMAWRA